MYLVGIANKLEDNNGTESWKSQNWAADKGFAFTRNDADSRFELTNVQLLAGATFGLATQLGTSASDTQTQADGRYYPVSSGNFEVGLSMVLSGTAITMNGVGENSKTGDFYVTQTGLYDIYVNDNGTVEFHNATDKIKLHGIGQIDNDNSTWSLTDAKLFRYAGTTDNGYQLKLNCQLKNGNQFCLSTSLDVDSWGNTNANRYYAATPAEGNFEMGTAYDLTKGNGDITFNEIDGSSTNYSNYVITVDVDVVNGESTPTNITFTKKPEGVSKVTVYLEKNGNVSNPVIHASNEGNDLSATQLTNVDPTSDNREWYAWEIQNGIADIYFTDGSKTSPTMSRKTGKLYYTWNADGTLSDYTRDYYDVSAGTNPSCAVQLENGEYYVYFINTLGWKNVYCYAWKGTNTELLGNWPGKDAMLVGFDENDNEVWTYNFGQISGDGIPTEVIFNDGGSAGSGQQTGDLTWVNGSVYDMLGSVSLGRTLALALALEKADGTNTTVYTIDNDLTAVYWDGTNSTLYCKDDNDLSVSAKSLNTEGKDDYMLNVSSIENLPSHYDQSNWIAIQSGVSESMVGSKLKGGHITGTIQIDQYGQAEMTLTEDVIIDGEATYTPNVYIPAAFTGQQYVTGAHDHQYFFVEPKAQEYAKITWAVLDIEQSDISANKLHFKMPEAGATFHGVTVNTAGLSGEFTAYLQINSQQASDFENMDGKPFEFNAIIMREGVSSTEPPQGDAPRRGVKRKVEGEESGQSSEGYVVYPTDLEPENEIITAVRDVNAKRTVSRVTYVSPAGMRSAEPFEGVNIVITTYTDGTTSASKILK